MSLIAIGFSQAPDPQEAAYQAAMMIKNQFKENSVDLVILFSSIHYAHNETLEAIHTILHPARLIGSSSAGILLSDGVFNRGIAMVAINSTTMSFGVGSSTYATSQDARKFGFDLARKLSLDYKSLMVKQAVLSFCDGFLPYDNDFALGAQEVVGQTCPLIGGFACDDFKFKKSVQFHDKEMLSRSASGLLIGASNSSVAFSSKHGFIPLGKPRTITLAEGPIIRSIDGQPAVHLYEEYFKDDLDGFKKGFMKSPGIIYPLGIYLEEQRQYLIRYPVDILNDGSIVCQADVPSNAEIHLMITNKESCKKAATAAALEIKEALEGRPPEIVFVFESIIQHKILGQHPTLEIQAIKQVLGQQAPIIGMYSFGELSRLSFIEGYTTTFLQNGSLLLLAIG